MLLDDTGVWSNVPRGAGKYGAFVQQDEVYTAYIVYFGQLSPKCQLFNLFLPSTYPLIQISTLQLFVRLLPVSASLLLNCLQKNVVGYFWHFAREVLQVLKKKKRVHLRHHKVEPLLSKPVELVGASVCLSVLGSIMIVKPDNPQPTPALCEPLG